VSAGAAGTEVRLFLDANIIVSGIAFSGAESDLLLLAEQGVYEAVTSEYVMAQVERVLLGKLRLSEPLVRRSRKRGWWSKPRRCCVIPRMRRCWPLH